MSSTPPLNNGHDWRERMDRVERGLEGITGRLERLTERHERLTERHEALAETIEIIAGMQRVNETQIAKVLEAQAKNETILADVLESINSLGRIAHSHEKRIGDLEERA